MPYCSAVLSLHWSIPSHASRPEWSIVRQPDWFYAGSQGALLTKYDRSTGFRRDIQVYPRFFSGEPSSALPERWQWTFPIIFSPLNEKKLYTCSQHVWVSEDDGQMTSNIEITVIKN